MKKNIFNNFDDVLLIKQNTRGCLVAEYSGINFSNIIISIFLLIGLTTFIYFAFTLNNIWRLASIFFSLVIAIMFLSQIFELSWKIYLQVNETSFLLKITKWGKKKIIINQTKSPLTAVLLDSMYYMSENKHMFSVSILSDLESCSLIPIMRSFDKEKCKKLQEKISKELTIPKKTNCRCSAGVAVRDARRNYTNNK